jgi:hypothetical protein
MIAMQVVPNHYYFIWAQSIYGTEIPNYSYRITG